MSTTADLVLALKRDLKAAQMTYADLARALEMAKSSVKRMLAGGDMPLSRMVRSAGVWRRLFSTACSAWPRTSRSNIWRIRSCPKRIGRAIPFYWPCVAGSSKLSPRCAGESMAALVVLAPVMAWARYRVPADRTSRVFDAQSLVPMVRPLASLRLAARRAGAPARAAPTRLP